MKLTAAVSAITLAVGRLGTTAASSVSRIQLAADLGYWILRVNKLDPIGVTDGAGVLGELFVDFFKARTDNAVLADAIAADFYKALRDDAGFTDAQIVDFFKSFVDSATTSDTLKVDYAKPAVADEVSLLENAVYAFGKALTDSPGFSDTEYFDFFKALTDGAATSDAAIAAVGKALADSAAATDTAARGIAKVLVDQITLTDDFDGAASILDDQTMQFQKTRVDVAAVADSFYRLVAFVRAFADTAIFSDAESRESSKALVDSAGAAELAEKAFSKAPFLDGASVLDAQSLQSGLGKSESTLLSDTGSLRSQGYCDFTYFAEDFVGASRTF